MAILQKAVSVAEAAKLLGIGSNLAYNAIQRGEIPSVRVGGRILVTLEALDQMLDTNPGVGNGYDNHISKP